MNEIQMNQAKKQNFPMYHICHVCHDYRSAKKSDIKRHLQIQKTCVKKFDKYESSEYFTLEDAIRRSFKNRYIIPFDVTNLCSDDYIYIITDYTDVLNIVEYVKVIENRKAHKLSHLPTIPIPDTTDDFLQTSDDLGTSASEVPSDSTTKPKKFQCPRCFISYVYKKDLVKHAQNPESCTKRQALNKALVKYGTSS